MWGGGALSADLSPIEHLWHELCRRVYHRQNIPEALQDMRNALVHECNNTPTRLYPTIDWFYASERRSCDCWQRWSHRSLNSQTIILRDNFCLSMMCSDNDVEKLCWYCLICYTHMILNYTIFVDCFLYVKNIEQNTLVSFLLLTSI